MRIQQLMMSYQLATLSSIDMDVRDDPSFMFPRFEMRIREQEKHLRQLRYPLAPLLNFCVIGRTWPFEKKFGICFIEFALITETF